MTNTKEDGVPPLSIPIELLRKSPRGLVACATDWLAGAKGAYGFDVNSPGFAAAGSSLLAAPEVFVGAASDESWDELKLVAFWRLFFEARAKGTPPAPLSEALAKLDKKQLSKGAKDMMILAARSRDAKSFGELLDMGAARRSKLVMFSAYQNGGKEVALQVKKPTAKEAVEMLENGSRSYSWCSREMSHDPEGFCWLLSLAGHPIDAMKIAAIAANAPDPGVLSKVVEMHKDKMSFEEPNRYIVKVPVSEVEIRMAAACAFGTAGSAQGAKALAISFGGEAAWKELCAKGARSVWSLPIRRGRVKGRSSDLCETDSPAFPGPWFTIQAAVCLSREVDACRWLREEYARAGIPWLPAQDLSKIYARIAEGPRQNSIRPTALIDEALSLSEAIDLGGGVAPAHPSRAVEAARRPRSKSL